MEFTGERYIPNLDHPEISYEHWHRYLYATQFVKDKVVLDIACGEGYGSYLLSQYAERVIGVDISSEAISYASSKYVKDNLKFKVGSAGSIPVEGKEIFDIIVSFETIEHINEDEQRAFLKEIKRLLKPDGIFIVSTPNKLLYSDIPNYKNEFHIKEFYVNEFKDFLNQYFFNVTLLGQKIYPISYIWHPDTDEHQVKEYRLQYSGNGFRPTEKAKDILYTIALCSDKTIETNASILVDLNEKILKLKDQHIGNLEAAIKDKDVYIGNLEAAIKDKDVYIGNLEAALREKDARIGNLEATLNNIYNSHGWRALLVYYRVRDKILPPDSTRREVIKSILHFNKALLKWKSLSFNWTLRDKILPPNTKRRLLAQTVFGTILESKKTHRNINKLKENLIQIKDVDAVEREGTNELCTFNENQFFWTYDHYSAIAQLPTSSVVDIIICLGGNSELLYSCINSIKLYTNPNSYRLNLIVHEKDITMLDQDIKKMANIFTHSMEIFNFAKANNIIVSQCKGDVVLLNDDTEVTQGWLEKLKHDSKGFALTGAHTGFQCSGNPDMWGEDSCTITWYPINMFCTYIPRRILEVVGLLDEEFCYYGGEDVDYSCRALLNGFPLVISSAYVHHKGTQSFGEKKARLMAESDKIILERYGVTPPFNLSKVNPFVSVITATRNRQEFLPVAANSILDGLYPNLELIIVDDASDDGTWSVIEDIQKNDNRVTGIKLPKQVGGTKARQRGINASNGPFIAFMDDDDLARPNRIMAPLQHLLMHPELDAVYCSYDVVFEDKRVPGNTKAFNADDYLNLNFDIGSGALLLRKNLQKHVPFMSTYDRAIDYDWVFRIIRRGFKIDYCPAVVLDYNRRGDANTHLSGNTESIKIHNSIQERERLINENKRK